MSGRLHEVLKPKKPTFKHHKKSTTKIELPSKKQVRYWTFDNDKKTVNLFSSNDSVTEIRLDEPDSLAYVKDVLMMSCLFDTKCKFKLKKLSDFNKNLLGRFQFKMLNEKFYVWSDTEDVLSLKQTQITYSDGETDLLNIISIVNLQDDTEHSISGLNCWLKFPSHFRLSNSVWNFKLYHSLKYGYRDEKDPHIIFNDFVINQKSGKEIKTSWEHLQRVVYLIMPKIMKQSVHYKSKLIDISKVVHYNIDPFGWVYLSSSPLIEKTNFIQVFNIHHLLENKLFFDQLKTLLNIKQVEF